MTGSPVHTVARMESLAPGWLFHFSRAAKSWWPVAGRWIRCGAMKRFSFILLAILSGFVAAAGHAAEKDTVRVLTFNLRYMNLSDLGAKMWTERREVTAELMRKDAADFIGVQEALRQMIDDLKARVPGYGELGVGRDDGKQKGEYSAILYREAAWEAAASGTFWLSDTPEVAGSATWGNKVTRVCTWGRFKHKVSGSELFVFNAHF